MNVEKKLRRIRDLSSPSDISIGDNGEGRKLLVSIFRITDDYIKNGKEKDKVNYIEEEDN